VRLLSVVGLLLIIVGGLSGLGQMSTVVVDTAPPIVSFSNISDDPNAMTEFSNWRGPIQDSLGVQHYYLTEIVLRDRTGSDLWLKISGDIYGDWFRSWPYPMEDGYIKLLGEGVDIDWWRSGTFDDYWIHRETFNGDGVMRIIQTGYTPYRYIEDGVEYGVKLSFESGVPPVVNGETVTISVKSTDGVGHTTVKRFYVYNGAPEGYFTINGQRVGTDTTIHTDSATVDFAFIATKNSGEIGNVWIDVKKAQRAESSGFYTWDVGSYSLVKVSGDRWELSYTFPEDAMYFVYGLFDSSVTDEQWQALSITVPIDFSTAPEITPEAEPNFSITSEGDLIPIHPSNNWLLSLGMVGLGAFLVYHDRRKK